MVMLWQVVFFNLVTIIPMPHLHLARPISVCREPVAKVGCYAFCKTSDFHGYDKYYPQEHARDSVWIVFGIL